MKVTLPYGKGHVEVAVPDGSSVVYPRQLPPVPDVGPEIRRAMAAPIGSPPLRDVAAGKRDAIVVINDITRPAPSRDMLAAILDELRVAGVAEAAVTVVIATGNHRPNTPEEIARMVGEDFARRLRIVNHDCEHNRTLTAISAPGVDIPIRVNFARGEGVAENPDRPHRAPSGRRVQRRPKESHARPIFTPPPW